MTGDFTVEGLHVLPTNRTVADTLSVIESLARERGLTVFARIDFSGDAIRAGVPMPPSGLLILGNPKAGTPLMLAAPTVGIDLPLKVLSWQDPEGRRWVAYNDADYLRARHGFPAELVKNISALGALVQAAIAAHS